MLLKHPEAVVELPRETILQDWNYGWEPSSVGHVSALQDAGFEVWGMPSVRCAPDGYRGTRWRSHLNNLRDFVPHCRSAGYIGMIQSSWAYSGECGYEWEARSKLLELHGMGRRYPTSGFRMALDAFACALRIASPIRPAEVVCRYARDRFGLTVAEARKLWHVLKIDATPAEVLGTENHNDPRAVLRKALGARRTLTAIRPGRNSGEFEHFRLMIDLTIQQLRIMAIEREVHSDGFTAARRGRTARKLAKLFPAAEDLDRRFIELNTGYLHSCELAEENRLRNRKMHLLYDRLSGRC